MANCHVLFEISQFGSEVCILNPILDRSMFVSKGSLRSCLGISHPPPVLWQGVKTAHEQNWYTLENMEKGRYFQQRLLWLISYYENVCHRKKLHIQPWRESSTDSLWLPQPPSSVYARCYEHPIPYHYLYLLLIILFDLEASPEGSCTLLGTLCVGNSSWLFHQSLPSWLLLGVCNPWFGCNLSVVTCSFTWMSHRMGSPCIAQHNLYREHSLTALKGLHTSISARCSEHQSWWCFTTYISNFPICWLPFTLLLWLTVYLPCFNVYIENQVYSYCRSFSELCGTEMLKHTHPGRCIPIIQHYGFPSCGWGSHQSLIHGES